MWELLTVLKDDMPIKVYVNKNDTKAVIFPLFGKYFTVNSDRSAKDLMVEFIFNASNDFGIKTYLQYEVSQEDTAIINQKAA